MASGFNMRSGNGDGVHGSGPSEQESNAGLQSLLAQLQRSSTQENLPTASQHFNPQQHQHHHAQQQPAYNQQPQHSFYAAQQHNQYPQQQHHQQHEEYVSPVDEDNYSNNHMPSAPTPPVAGFPNTQFPPGMLGSIGSGRPNQPGTSSQLLNLLKFSGPGSQNAPGHSSVPQEAAARDLEPRHHSGPSAVPSMIHAPAPVPSDPTGLLAALMQGHMKDEPAVKPEIEPPASSNAWASTSQSNDTQQYLLNLLNRPKPSQNEDQTYQQDMPHPTSLSPQSRATERAQDNPVATILQDALSGHPETGPMPNMPTSKSFDFESPKPTSSYDFEGKKSASEDTMPSKASMFTYNNPFDDLAASSPLNRTPKSSTTPNATSASHTAAIPIQILKKPGSSQSSTQDGKRRKLDSAGPSYESPKPADEEEDTEATAGTEDKQKETVSDAVLDLADKADKEAQEALARAEEEQAQATITKEMNELLEAKTEKEFQVAAQSTGRAIKNELEKDENKDILESTLSPEMAQAVRQIVDDAANGVADSWESADADTEDKIIVEEAVAPPVRVYNFPMKPWIAIHVQDVGKEDRSLFREESIIDIARLKKDFDQIDRNLVTACESYMAFGMSKNGGIRIIRQSDGRDFKIFTSTKDRIFNVAMSHAARQDTEGEPIIPKTSLLATGISGTVYWVQIRVGDKDTLDDANPEQCGFALPPITAHESDAPGGVLKTRARTSSSHPEFFAVGRGKSINFIWPGLIMEQQPFKPGHDRVVDITKLINECSLKINTGKAGKDFTFSLDDTVVVSLDKSGRVKFWDVRDLTAVKEGCDPRNQVPAQASLEVKEPLWTLTTTPEGEKAWPTSVLLLDKARPYQKRTAMRYMVVGMKQNHTLQLWDLALGKPVQEFNLPHSKESDAVCSIMYHPPTGMLVVGHPTRNSIFFLHVSAPKYNLKGLTQVDYIQRLRAQDSSVPQPESTAVISGIREYSFENRGILRSLDMVPQAQGESESLFELYAMHSKGVACIAVKQAELGWTKDSKVIMPVDAIESGMVVIDKLKSPLQHTPQLETHGSVPTDSNSPAPRILPSRAKENKSQNIANHDDANHQDEPATASKSKAEVTKEEETQPATAAAAEKPEKRGRKKKAAAAAAAAAGPADRENNGLSNGSSNSSNLSPNKSSETSKTPQMPNSITQEEFESRINKMETLVCERIAGTVHIAFDAQKKDLDSRLQARDLDFERKQGKLIDMVSEVLNTNTQKVLGKIVLDQFDQAVMPALRQDVAKSISEQLSTKLNNQIQNVLQREVQKSMSSVLTPSLKALDLPASVSAKVTHTVATTMEQQLGNQLNEKLIPAVTSITNQAAQRVAHDVYQQTADRINQFEQQQRVQNAKMDSLMELVSRLSDTVASMAGAQAQSHSDILKFQSQVLQHQAAQPVPQTFQHRQFGDSTTNASLHSPATTRLSQQQPTQQSPRSQHSHHSYEQQVVYQPKSREDRDRFELDQLAQTIDDLLKEGRNDIAMMRWLQSTGREQDLFKRVLSKYSPTILQNLQPLVLLTVGTTVSLELTDSYIVARLQWLEAVILGFFQVIHNLDDQTREITPKTMGNIKNRMEAVFMHISSMKPNDPSLKSVAQMTTIIGRIIDMTSSPNPY